MKRSLTSSGLLGCLLLAFATAVEAQTAVSLGYQLLHVPDETFPVGLNADVSRVLVEPWSLVGEIGWSKDNQDEPGVGGSITFLHYGGGPRWTLGRTGARPFAQLIAGGIRASADTMLTDDTDHAFMVQPGVGIVVPFRGVGLLGQFDFRHVFFEEEGDDEWRLVLGVRIALP